MKTIAVVQARLSSTRLPGKVLMDLGGQPLIVRVLERAAAIPEVSQVVLATSVHDTFNGRWDWADVVSLHIPTLPAHVKFHWAKVPVDDVLGRFLSVAELHEPDSIVRITGDCPFIAPEVASQVLRVLHHGGYDFVADLSWPGLDIEAFTVKALRETAATPTTEDREHVTPSMYRRGMAGPVIPQIPHYPWLAVDQFEDLERARRVFGQLTPGRLDRAATWDACRRAGLV